MEDYWLEEEHFLKAEANGISRDNLKQRFYEYGWDLERAMSQKVRKVRKFVHNEEMLALAKRNGLCSVIYRDRVTKLGWDERRAATTPKMTPQERAAVIVSIRTKFTDEQIETFTRNGIPRGTVRQRLRIGWSMEEAITIPPFKTGQRREQDEERFVNRSFGEPQVPK